MRKGVAVVAGKRKAIGFTQRCFDIACLEGEGERTARLRHGSFRLTRKRSAGAKGIAIAPRSAAAVLLDKVGGNPDLLQLALGREPDRDLMAVAVRPYAHTGVAQRAYAALIDIEVLPARRRAGKGMVQ